MQQKKISSKDASNEISNLNKTVPVFEKKIKEILEYNAKTVDYQLSKLGKINFFVFSLEKELENLNVIGRGLLAKNSAYSQEVLAKVDLLMQLRTGVKERNFLLQTLGMPRDSTYSGDELSNSILDLKNCMISIKNDEIAKKKAAKKNYRTLQKISITGGDDNDDKVIAHYIQQAKVELEKYRKGAKEYCETLGEEYFSSGDEDNIFSSAEMREGVEFRENIKKYGKIAFDAAIDHLPKTLSALAEEGLITTCIGVATGGVGLTAYGVYKMVDVASSIPEIQNQLEAIYENCGNISTEKK